MPNSCDDDYHVKNNLIDKALINQHIVLKIKRLKCDSTFQLENEIIQHDDKDDYG